MRLWLLVILFALNSGFLICQSSINDSIQYVEIHGPSNIIGPVMGYRGVGNHLAEIGLFFGTASHGVTGFDASYVTNFKKGNEQLSGISLSYFGVFAIFEAGVNGTLYLSRSDALMYLRPYFAMGIGGFITLGYGYNISLGKNVFRHQINQHELRLIVRIPVKGL